MVNNRFNAATNFQSNLICLLHSFPYFSNVSARTNWYDNGLEVMGIFRREEGTNKWPLMFDSKQIVGRNKLEMNEPRNGSFFFGMFMCLVYNPCMNQCINYDRLCVVRQKKLEMLIDYSKSMSNHSEPWFQGQNFSIFQAHSKSLNWIILPRMKTR